MKFKFFIMAFCCSALLMGCDTPEGSVFHKDYKKDQEVKPVEPNAVSQVIQEIEEAIAPAKNAFNPLIVYDNKGTRDNHFVPSGFMPNGNCIVFNDRWTVDCQSGSSCMKIEYDIQCSKNDQKWAGIYWLNPANNWGQRKGGFNLTGAQKLTFWAKGEIGGEQIQEFTIGGITGNYPDTDIAVLGPVILTPEWKKYTVDLRGKDLTYISGGFSWTSSVEVNPDSCTFFLDNIRFE